MPKPVQLSPYTYYKYVATYHIPVQFIPEIWQQSYFKKAYKKKKAKNLVILSLSLSVGITGLEPATSRPPDVCATNCAKSRSKYSVPMDSVCIAISRKRVQRYDDFLNLANFLVTF